MYTHMKRGSDSSTTGMVASVTEAGTVNDTLAPVIFLESKNQWYSYNADPALIADGDLILNSSSSGKWVMLSSRDVDLIEEVLTIVVNNTLPDSVHNHMYANPQLKVNGILYDGVVTATIGAKSMTYDLAAAGFTLMPDDEVVLIYRKL